MRDFVVVALTGDVRRRRFGARVVDLLKTARHGPGENIYLVEFEYRPDPD